MDEIEKIIPPKISIRRAISLGKFKVKIKKISGINKDLCGSYQPESSKREDVNNFEKINVIMDCNNSYPNNPKFYS